MDKLKAENFLKAHKGVDIPRCVPLSEVQAERIRSLLSEKLNIENGSNDLLLVERVDSQQALCDGIDAGSAGFSLRNTFATADIKIPVDVFINWYRFAEIDTIEFDSLDKYFDDIWYPGSDDIDIFDASLMWVLSVTHDGRVKFLKFPRLAERRG